MSGLNVNLSVRIEHEVGEMPMHWVVLNGATTCGVEEKYLPCFTVLPWKEFLLSMIGVCEDDLYALLAEIEEGTF